MNVLRNLSGTVSREELTPLSPAITFSDEPTPGLIRQAQFGPDGLMLINTNGRVFVPLRELFRVAEGKDYRVAVLVKVPRRRSGGPPPMPGDRQAGNDRNA
jgi:hypothetical protein